MTTRKGRATRGEFSELTLEVRGLKAEIGGVRGEVAELREDVHRGFEDIQRGFAENGGVLRQILRAIEHGNTTRDVRVDDLERRVQRLEENER